MDPSLLAVICALMLGCIDHSSAADRKTISPGRLYVMYNAATVVAQTVIRLASLFNPLSPVFYHLST